jgi:hypothetical protein
MAGPYATTLATLAARRARTVAELCALATRVEELEALKFAVLPRATQAPAASRSRST